MKNLEAKIAFLEAQLQSLNSLHLKLMNREFASRALLMAICGLQPQYIQEEIAEAYTAYLHLLIEEAEPDLLISQIIEEYDVFLRTRKPDQSG